MGIRLPGLGLAAVLLLGGFAGPGPAQTPAASTPGSGQRITIIGAVKRQGAEPHQVIFAGDDGREYTLDTSHARITLPPDGPQSLISGTRVYVSGYLSAGRNIAVSRLQVIPVAPPPPSVIPPTVGISDPPDLTVRGTVEAVDFERGSFVLRINTHTRIVFVTADTDVSGLSSLAAGRFPVQPGQRVTVGGSLQPDGTVLAGLLTQKEDVDFRAASTQANRVLLGTVSSAANKLVRRDIKIRIGDGTETKISVPRSIPIRRMGRQISVYDLSSRDDVRITGRINGSDFQAFRIDVLAPPPDAVPAEPLPVR